MLTELETQLIAAIQASPIAPHLRKVDAMPDADAKTLTSVFAASAPGVFVVAGAVVLADATALVQFDLICLARNSRGNTAARRGDPQTIGLYQILDGLAQWLNNHATTDAVWQVKRIDFSKNDIWQANNLSAGSVALETTVSLSLLDTSGMGEFITFHGDYDIEPFETLDEHNKWLHEPADYSTSLPELTDITTLPR